jgi:hypothetical protein
LLRSGGSDQPGAAISTRQALADLELDRLLVLTPSDRGYRLNERCEVMPLAQALRQGL